MARSHGGEHARPPTGALRLAVGALGIVYGDIGTSPLYAFREAFEGHDLVVTHDGVIGACSLTFWALIIVISVKYVLLVMRADNEGEGGILALTSLLPRRAGRIGAGLVALGLFGTAMLYGDGMITPAISVLSAVEGLRVATDSFDHVVVPIAVVILAALFLVQRRGTGGIARVFGPIMLVWFTVIALLGAVQVSRNPAILQALSPHHALTFFTEYHIRALWALGSIFLVVTGGEALYADLGHFGRRPISIGWFSFVLPALALNYLGQGALLLRRPQAISNPFFRMGPSWAIWPLVLLATVSTVIASQALISGAFSLTTQAMQADYVPRLRVLHTSSSNIGQVYVPVVNWILMAASLGLVVGFETSSRLAAAYGIAVTLTMAITTQLFMVVASHRWQWSRAKVLVVGVPLLTIDLAFLVAQVVKIPHGGWFALAIGISQFTLMTTWRTGRRELSAELRRGELPVVDFVASLEDKEWTRVSGTAAFLFKDAGATPPALLENLEHNKVLHDRVLLVSVVTAQRAHVPVGERARAVEAGCGIFEVELTFGYMDEPNVPGVLARLDLDGPVDVDRATYFLGRETIVSTPKRTLPRWQERLFVMQTRTAASAARFFHLPSRQVFEVGTTIEF
jgi:KUP system potassium uptake protein